MVKAKDLMKLINEAGFTVMADSDRVWLEPSHIRISHLSIYKVRRGMHKADPALVPPELKDDNILWIDEPPQVSMQTETGNEVDIIFTDPENMITLHQEVIHPDAN